MLKSTVTLRNHYQNQKSTVKSSAVLFPSLSDEYFHFLPLYDVNSINNSPIPTVSAGLWQ